MRRPILELSAAIALTIGAIIASASHGMANDVMVMSAFARASATPAAKAGAAYVTLMNHGGETDRLLAISTPAAAMAEVHVTRVDGDIVKMEPAGSIDVPAGGTVEMKPGGLHVMMMGLKAPLKQGGTVELTLSFEKAGDVTVVVPVGSPAASGPDQASGG